MKKTYKIIITEIFQRVETVEAYNVTEAITQVSKDYISGEILLNGTDFAQYKIEEFKEE